MIDDELMDLSAFIESGQWKRWDKKLLIELVDQLGPKLVSTYDSLCRVVDENDDLRHQIEELKWRIGDSNGGRTSTTR